MPENILNIEVVSKAGAAIRLERVILTEEAKKALALTREQLAAVPVTPDYPMVRTFSRQTVLRKRRKGVVVQQRSMQKGSEGLKALLYTSRQPK